MATSREDARLLKRCGWRANGRLHYPTIYITSWDTTVFFFAGRTRQAAPA